MRRQTSTRPLNDDEFACLMDACGPFEAAPHLAVAVSGGPDSMALTLLAHDWVRARKGRLTALTVDHHLRPESAAEARQVGTWLAARNVAHRILDWKGEKPKGGLMAAARAARYALLQDWCREYGVLNLLLGHEEEDQAATFLMRLGRGSGLDGLAGMRPVTPGFPRLVRPLLGIPRHRLKATLKAQGQTWIDDPTNRSTAYERNRADAFLAGDNSLGLDVAGVALAAQSLAQAREALHTRVCEALVATTVLSPLGAAEMKTEGLMRYEAEVQLRALARILLCIGAHTYAPRRQRLLRLWSAVRNGAIGGGKTLAGCRIIPQGDSLLFLRETAAIAAPHPVPSRSFCWDDRFRLSLPEALSAPSCRVQRLDQAAWREMKAHWAAVKDMSIPARLRWTLPVIRDGERIAAAPHYAVVRDGIDPDDIAVSFTPRHPLT